MFKSGCRNILELLDLPAGVSLFDDSCFANWLAFG
jgi:hypothetical protein